MELNLESCYLDDICLYCYECENDIPYRCMVHNVEWIMNKKISCQYTITPCSNFDRYFSDDSVAVTCNCHKDYIIHLQNSLPDVLIMKQSSMNKSEVGIWTSRTIAKGTIFGPFLGKLFEIKKPFEDLYERSVNGYAWIIWNSTIMPRRSIVNATDPFSSNWMRCVRMCVNLEQQNLLAIQYDGLIFYRACEDILPDTELLISYEIQHEKDVELAKRQLPNYGKLDVFNIERPKTDEPQKRIPEPLEENVNSNNMKVMGTNEISTNNIEMFNNHIPCKKSKSKTLYPGNGKDIKSLISIIPTIICQELDNVPSNHEATESVVNEPISNNTHNGVLYDIGSGYKYSTPSTKNNLDNIEGHHVNLSSSCFNDNQNISIIPVIAAKPPTCYTLAPYNAQPYYGQLSHQMLYPTTDSLSTLMPSYYGGHLPPQINYNIYRAYPLHDFIGPQPRPQLVRKRRSFNAEKKCRKIQPQFFDKENVPSVMNKIFEPSDPIDICTDKMLQSITHWVQARPYLSIANLVEMVIAQYPQETHLKRLPLARELKSKLPLIRANMGVFIDDDTIASVVHTYQTNEHLSIEDIYKQFTKRHREQTMVDLKIVSAILQCNVNSKLKGSVDEDIITYMDNVLRQFPNTTKTEMCLKIFHKFPNRSNLNIYSIKKMFNFMRKKIEMKTLDIIQDQVNEIVKKICSDQPSTSNS